MTIQLGVAIWLAIGTAVAGIARLVGPMTMFEVVICAVLWPVVVYEAVEKGIKREREFKKRERALRARMDEVQSRLAKPPYKPLCYTDHLNRHHPVLGCCCQKCVDASFNCHRRRGLDSLRG